MVSDQKIIEADYLKAGYIYNLANFVLWPQNVFNFSVSPFLIGLYGNKEIKTAIISSLRDKKIQNREWKVGLFDSVKSIGHCHLIFISGSNLSEASQLIKEFNKKPILLLADNINGFCKEGGMVNLVGNFPNFGYQVNTNAINQGRLKLQPEFLELATIIE
ncbi:MAG: YfiR family protein [Bacteroidales bacterium]